jgi:hypothetical protein
MNKIDTSFDFRQDSKCGDPDTDSQQLYEAHKTLWSKDGLQPFVSYDKLKSVKVQVPNNDKQIEIAAILDKFDALVNDISVGLPAELNARRKQYEYYRGKLLTFERKI